MSCHVIYYDNGAKLMRPVSSREEYMALRDSEFQRHLVQKVRQGDVNSKKKLVQFNYSCLPTADGKLAGSKVASCSVMMDIDGVQESDMAGMGERILAHKDEIGLLMLEVSARNRGYHLVFRRRPELSQEENLSMAAEVLGVQFDAAAKDITRVFFTTTAEDLVYLDDELFDQEAAPIILNQPPVSKTTETYITEYKGIPFEQIIAEYWRQNGGEPEQGERNCRLFELCCTLAPISNYSPEFLTSIIPAYGLEADEIRGICTSACKADRRGVMPFRLRQVLKTLSAEKQSVVCAEAPPALPKKLPKLLKLLSSKVPEHLKPAVCEAVFPALATQLKGVKFRYLDNSIHEATLMHILVAKQSAGKSCIKTPLGYIMADIAERDKISRQKEAEWKAANSPNAKEKKPRPNDICIQMLAEDCTSAAFTQRVIDVAQNGGRFLYSQLDELDAIRNITTSKRLDEVSLLIRKAFDNSLHGSERVSADSVSGIAPLRWNFIASTTPANCLKFLRNAANDGTLSRLSFSTIEGNDEMPVYGEYDESFAAALRPYIDNLNMAEGEIECRQARKMAQKLMEEFRRKADEYDSEAYRVLSFRALMIGYLKACVLYVANGQQWESAIEEYIRYSINLDMWVKMRYFGEILAKLQADEEHAAGYMPTNLLAKLPMEFTYDDYLSCRRNCGKTADGKALLRQWLHRHYIVYDDVSHVYKKSEQ